MLFKNISIIDENFDCQHNKWIGILNDKIDYIGDNCPDNTSKYGDKYDGNNKLIIPAFYNAHAHGAMTLLRGYAENVSLQTWLNDYIWPFEAKMTPEDIYWATLLACAEMSRFGVVSYTDMYFAIDHRAEATTQCFLKANLSEGLIAFDEKPFDQYHHYQIYERAIPKWHGADDGRILIDANLHAEYTTNPLTAKDVADYAKQHKLRMQVHVSETKSEHEECKERHSKMTPVRYLESIGVFDVPTTAAHCVWIDDDDIEILKAKNVSVACNPASNMKLGSGFAPVNKMIRSGINVCIGTDGVASNNNHNMMKDLYLLATIYKGSTSDPTCISAKQALYAATRAGALSQGRNDCGLIKEGFKADLCVLDMSNPSWVPSTNILSNIVYAGCGSDIVLTMCDGRIAYNNGNWPVDIELAKSKVEEITKRIVSEL